MELMLSLNFELLLVTVSLEVSGSLTISAVLPEAVSGPIASTLWVLETFVHELMKFSRVGAHFLNNDDNSAYIAQVVTGVEKAQWPGLNGGCPYHFSPGGDSGGTCDWFDCDTSRNALCQNDKCMCNAAAFPCGPSPGHASWWSGTCMAQVDAQAVPDVAQTLSDTFAEMWHNYVASMSNSCLKDNLPYCNAGGAVTFAATPNSREAVMMDAMTFATSMKAKGSGTLSRYYTDFMLSHFLYRMLGVTFNPQNGNWADHQSVNCADNVKPWVYYTASSRIYKRPPVTESSVRSAMVRLCSFMASGVLVPPSQRANSDSTFYSSEHENSNMLNMLNVLVPDIFVKKPMTSWIKAGNASVQAANLGMMGGNGTHLSTFHHMMSILSGEATSVQQQLNKYVTQKQAGNKPAQTCETGIQSVTGAVNFQVSAGTSGASNMCNPGDGGGVGVAVGATFGFAFSSEKSKTAPCNLGPFGKAKITLGVDIAITNIPALIPALGETDIVLDVDWDFDYAKETFAYTGFDITILMHKVSPVEPDPDMTQLKSALPPAMTAAYTGIAELLVASLTDIVNYFAENPQKKGSGKGKGASAISSVLTNVLQVGYKALASLLGSVFSIIEKNTAGDVAADVAKYAEKLAGGTALIKKLAGGALGATFSSLAAASVEHQDAYGITLVLDQCTKNCTLTYGTGKGTHNFEIHLIIGDISVAEIEEPVQGSGYFMDLSDYIVLQIVV